LLPYANAQESDRIRALLPTKTERATESLYEFVRQAWSQIESAPFIDNWHIGFWCEHLQAVTEGQIENLLGNYPPSCSKSLLTCVFWPAWEWTRNQTIRWFFATYNQRLTMRDSVKCRTLLNGSWYQSQWPIRFLKDQDQKMYYETTKGGWRLATRVAGYGTGEHPDRICVPPGTKIQSECGSVPVEKIRIGHKVLACDHHNCVLGWSQVTKLFCRDAEHLVEIETDFGTVRLTPNHPVFVIGKGYTSAEDLRPFDEVLYAGDVQLRGLQETIPNLSKKGKYRSESVLLEEVPALRDDWLESPCLAWPVAEVHRLQKRHSWSVGQAANDGEILLASMPEMDGFSARGTAVWANLRRAFANQNPGRDSGSLKVRDLRNAGRFDGPPSEWQLARQPGREPMHRVPIMPHPIARRERDIASKARVLSCRIVAYSGPVYNLEVAVANNYFANGILVHNCIDDPNSVKGGESEAERRAANDWWDLTMTTRGISRNVRRVVIQQRTNERDFTGHVLTRQKWVHIVLPMRFEKDRMATTPIGMNDPRKVEGELLAPVQLPEAKVKEMEDTLGTFGSAGQLQQRPVPREGGMFKRAWFKIVKAAPVDAKRVRWWDKAGTEGDGDFSVGLKMSRTPDGQYYIEDVKRDQWSAGQRDNVMKSTASTDGKSVHIWTEQEPGSGGKESAQNTIRMLAGYTVRAETASGSKEVRAEPFAAQFEAGNVFIVEGDWNNSYIDELCSFPNGKHDDQVDASSGAFNKLVAPKRLWVGSTNPPPKPTDGQPKA
jgi:predicted phage terminase large subunit-like protein